MIVIRFLAWPTTTLTEQLKRIPAMRRFDRWANDVERRWRRRRNVGLVRALEHAGLSEQAERLDAATRGGQK